MAEYDIASKVVPPKFDPLAVAGQVQSLQGSILQNRLLGMNVSQTQAQREAARQSIDPSTGQANPDIYETELAKGGADASALLQAQQQRQLALQTKIAGLGLTKAQMEVSAQELGNGAMVGQGILANGTKDPAALTKEGITTAINDNLVKTGLIKTPDALQHVKDFTAQLTDDPQQNGKLVQQWINQSTDITKALGTVTQTDVGPNILQQRINPATGEPVTTGVIGKGLSPSEANTPAYVFTDENGQQHIVTKQEAADAAKTGKPHAGGIVSGMKVGTPELAGQGVQFETGLTHAAQAWGDVHGQLSNFRTLVDQIASGPKAGSLKTIGQIATQFGLAPPSAKNDTAAMEEAGKLAYQIAQRQFQQLGGTGTDSKLDSAMHTSPSEFLTREGNRRIIPLLQGNNDALKAQAEAYQTWKASHGPQEFSKFVTQWNQHYDPRVFQAAYMAPAEVAALKKGMGKDERQNFDAFSAFAKSKGWLGGG